MLLSLDETVGAITVPVNSGLASGAFRSSAALRAAASADTAVVTYAVVATLVLLSLDETVGAITVPVNVGPAKLAFKFSAVCCAVETGLLASLVLSTLPKPIMVFVRPSTVLVNLQCGICNCSISVHAYTRT